MRISEPGHGWVRPIPFEDPESCGGPGICGQCGIEFAWMKEAVEHLYNWRTYGGDNFHSLLFVMFQKGTHGNRERLAEGFPWEFEAWNQWQSSKDDPAFFARFGIKTRTTNTEEPKPRT